MVYSEVHVSDQDGRFRRGAAAFFIYNDSFLLAYFLELLMDCEGTRWWRWSGRGRLEAVGDAISAIHPNKFYSYNNLQSDMLSRFDCKLAMEC